MKKVKKYADTIPAGKIFAMPELDYTYFLDMATYIESLSAPGSKTRIISLYHRLAEERRSKQQLRSQVEVNFMHLPGNSELRGTIEKVDLLAAECNGTQNVAATIERLQQMQNMPDLLKNDLDRFIHDRSGTVINVSEQDHLIDPTIIYTFT